MVSGFNCGSRTKKRDACERMISSLQHFAPPPPMEGPRVLLDPLAVSHAEEMLPLLGDATLYQFIGGNPPTLSELRALYEQQVVKNSPDGSQLWLNWIIRVSDNEPVGSVQATVYERGVSVVAEVAWVIGTAYQGNGYAREAATVMVVWLRSQGVTDIVANIHPDHQASAAVARSIGLVPGPAPPVGEVRWAG